MTQIRLFTLAMIGVLVAATSASAFPLAGNEDGLMNVQVINSSVVNSPGNSTAAWLAAWNAIGTGTGTGPQGGVNVQFNTKDTETVFDYAGDGGNFGTNRAIGTIANNGPAGAAAGPFNPAGNGGGDYSIRAQTFIRFATGGTYTMAMGSDDGRRMQLTGTNLTTGSPFTGWTAVNGQFGGAATPGLTPTVIGFDGGTGHNQTLGTFTVAAGDLLALDAFYYEGGGGDSGEISITNVATNAFTTGGANPFVLLQDGALNGAIQLSSVVAETPEPASLSLWAIFGVALSAVGIFRFRRARKS